MTKATEAKLDSSASPSATFSTPATSVADAASKQRGDAARAEELHRHHAVDLARAAEDAREADGDGQRG